MSVANPLDRPQRLALGTAGRGDWQLSAEAVAVARWLLRVVPPDEHLALCDLVAQVAIVKWADARSVICIEDIRDRWNCSRATAYRWLRALGRQNGVDARDQVPPPPRWQQTAAHGTRLRPESGTVLQ